MWVYIAKGDLYIREDAGYYKRESDKQTSVLESPSQKGQWIFFDKFIEQSEITVNNISFGLSYEEDSEVYIAMPYAYNPMRDDHMIESTQDIMLTND